MPWSNGLYSHKTDDGRSQKLKLCKLIFEKILTCVRCQIQGDSEWHVSVFRAELLERTNGTKEGGRETLPALGAGEGSKVGKRPMLAP